MSTRRSPEPALRVALFVEGTQTEALTKLWRIDLPASLEFRQVTQVIGFTKGHLTAMSVAQQVKTATSSVGYPFDQLFAAHLQREPFDVAVVAWDLLPPWNRELTGLCRWQETLSLYRGLVASSVAPKEKAARDEWQKWIAAAQVRLTSMARHDPPETRLRLQKHQVLPVCMEPEFEALLLSESGVREALGLVGKRVANWPKLRVTAGQKAKDVLDRALQAAKAHAPRPKVFGQLRRPIEEAPHEWASWFVRADSAAMRAHLDQHPLTKRLREVLPTR